MKRIRHNEQYFSIDYDANDAYYNAKTESHDLYERNFATQIRFRNPELNEFFDNFAIDLVKPDSIRHEDCEDGVRYELRYSAVGTIEGGEEYAIKISKMPICVKQEPEGRLTITVSELILPWILLEGRGPESAPQKGGLLKKLFRR